MKINHKIKMDLIRKGIPPRIHAVQDDALCRVLHLELTADDYPWAIPDDATVIIRYSKPDRTGGQYDTLPDGAKAWSARNNCLSVTLAPQVLTAPGTVELGVTMILGSTRLTTFLILIDVQHHPAFSGTSENYSYVTSFLPQPDSAQQGQYLRIREVDQQGNILALESVSAPGGGLNADSKAYLLQLLRSAVYTQDVSETVDALEQSLEDAAQTVVPSSLTALYSGGSVVAGTALGYFLGKVTVTRYYSDGSSKLLSASEYSVSGNQIVAGTNILTVTDLQTGMTASFTVVGTAVTYSISTVLLNETDGTRTEGNTAYVESGSSYTSTLTIPDGQELVDITVIMSGADITASSVSGNRISIGAVTGNVVITITVKESAAVFYSVTKNLTNASCSGASSVEENTSYTATITANEGFELQSVTITMGGADVTTSVYAGGAISIASVTGDIVITAIAANTAAEVTMTGISAVYTGGDVAIGTAVTELEGITVTAHYSDGSTQVVEKYALTGTIKEGSNTIVVSFNGFNTSFSVTGVETYPAICTVTNNMTGASTNNTQPGVAGGSKYTATITANEGFVLQSVVVTMGGEDVTAAVYNAATGIITIETVTGNIVITAVAKANEPSLLFNWDFTKSLVDTVSGRSAQLLYAPNSTALSTPTQTDSGLVFDAESQYCDLGEVSLSGRTLEIDVAHFEFKGLTTAHIRFVMHSSTTGIGSLIWRKTNGWATYCGSWSEVFGNAVNGTGTDVINFFDGKTVKLVYDASGYPSLYADGVLIGSSNISVANNNRIYIGACPNSAHSQSSGNQCYNMTITGVRIYQNNES